MRIFLTGATGYVGGAVLDALLRGGHDLTALVRDNEKAARVAARGGASGHRQSRATPSRFAAPPRRRTATCTRRSTRCPAAARPSRSSPSRRSSRRPGARGPRVASAGQTLRHLHVGCVGARQGAGSDRRRRAAESHRAWPSHRPEHERIVLEAATDTLRTMVVRPGVVYGGGSGIVGDIFKSATNGLVRVVGDGSNRWPLVYDHDLADLYAKLAVNQNAVGDLSRQRRGRRARQRHRGGDFAVPAGAARCAARADRGGADQDGTVRRRAGARSGRQKSARAGSRLDAHAAFSRRECRAAARRVARVEGLRVCAILPAPGVQSSPPDSVAETWCCLGLHLGSRQGIDPPQAREPREIGVG